MIRQEAQRLGFELVGFARACFMDTEAKRLENWLNQGFHGQMSYLGNHFDKRVDPTKLVPGAKSVISLVYNYFPERELGEPETPKLARYAYGKDYHFILKPKLRELLAFMQAEIGEIAGRCFVDSAPVLERDWALRAGIGWIGRNTLLIHPQKGSFFFLAELIVDLELPYADPMRDYCGTCTRCIDACPTDAILPGGYLLDARKCISYLTIELREAIPETFSGKMHNWMFGCDICQEVCPWNRFSMPHQEEDFRPHPELLSMGKRDWQELTEETFRRVFKKSAVKRAKFQGLMRNIKFLQNT